MGMFDFSGRYPFTRKTWPWLVGGTLILLGIALLLDATVARTVPSWPAPLPGFFGTITDAGQAYWILGPSLRLALFCAGLAVIIRDRLEHRALIEQVQLWSFVFLGVGVPSLVGTIVKRLIGRVRPPLLDSVGTLDFRAFANDWSYESFPSGHATTIFAFAMVVGFLMPRLFIPAFLLAMLVGISRIAVGAHYASDVIGGALCGILIAYGVRHVFAWRRWLFEIRPDGTIVRRPMAATRAVFSGRRGNA
jgi:undecaprenyl-diphosphatase